LQGQNLGEKGNIFGEIIQIKNKYGIKARLLNLYEVIE
jgi:hypothetical protein